jgi:hypothetical protein
MNSRRKRVEGQQNSWVATQLQGVKTGPVPLATALQGARLLFKPVVQQLAQRTAIGRARRLLLPTQAQGLLLQPAGQQQQQRVRLTGTSSWSGRQMQRCSSWLHVDTRQTAPGPLHLLLLLLGAPTATGRIDRGRVLTTLQGSSMGKALLHPHCWEHLQHRMPTQPTTSGPTQPAWHPPSRPTGSSARAIQVAAVRTGCAGAAGLQQQQQQ